MAQAMLHLALLLLAVTFAGSPRSNRNEPGPPEEHRRGSHAGGSGRPRQRQTALSINYQDVPGTLTLCVAVTCPLIPMSVLCA
uniref:uncharacterized protein LOC103791187 isoform X2 n=1 Tax=Callithrix jacchus TaxID=9483 RepID=UPI00083FF228|nr:uncharacterized protein LOC103791187 isoform X2 [Callithrix jacchus]XP_035146369.1 uncharacterized protein LOC103791187 isoform X2 [Callithrix jacchus]